MNQDLRASSDATDQREQQLELLSNVQHSVSEVSLTVKCGY